MMANTVIESWRSRFSPNTVAVRRRELKRFLAWMVDNGAHHDVLYNLSKVRKPMPRTVIATPAELDRLTQHAPPWQRCWLSITAGHGLRFAEANRLSRAQYDEHAATLTFRTKGQDTNTLPASDELQAFFKMAPMSADPNAHLIDLLAGRRLSGAYIRRQWQDLKMQAGVNPELRPHDLRRTLAVRTYDLTKDLRTVQHLLGHRNLFTTCGYLEHHDPAAIRPLLNQLKPNGGTRRVGFQN
ncbi:MAG TPA: site-specific integrase [Candidatus Acidoferrales bacterium]